MHGGDDLARLGQRHLRHGPGQILRGHCLQREHAWSYRNLTGQAIAMPSSIVGGAILPMMLQAQIEIVDEAGRVEDAVTIVGSGQVSVGMRDGSYLHADEAAPDLAVIQHTGSQVLIVVKCTDTLRQDDRYLARGAIDILRPTLLIVPGLPGIVEPGLPEVRPRYLKIKPLHIEGTELLSGGAVIRSTPSSFQSRLDEMAARGTQRVRDQLDRLRAQGKIDAAGNALVPLPADMLSDSPTDV
jgi:hypothetical protein